MDRRCQGKLNRAQGKHFERYIDEALGWYARTGRAVVEKTPEPMRPAKSLGNGKFIAFFEATAQPDYKGVLAGGRAVVFEAKHTATDRFEQSRVTDDQSRQMDMFCGLGAWCFVVLSFGSLEFFRVPWIVWRDMKEKFGRKYVTAQDLDEYRVPTGSVGQLLILD